ncbi:S-adenosyl-L-methionine-dependent methyltransferase [Limtongia smithiae]|uniref:S-adenosyl-L-methionine-dependent methyltransferase n=1 Tax=Limtongia smithiae TaxID=1125753 RepID=UPI0034CE024B
MATLPVLGRWTTVRGFSSSRILCVTQRRTQLPPPRPAAAPVFRSTLPPEPVAPKTNVSGISERELQMRKRKFLLAAGGIYLVFVAGAYYYLTSGVASNGPYEEASPRDTKEYYEKLAAGYDKIVNRDEQFMFLSFWRKDVTKQLKGDVLEVSCGTGRNVNYLDIAAIKSITFLDTSPKMVKLTKEKFDDRYPKYANVNFVVSRIEDIPEGEKYDTIYETFGLCSYEDPVAALVHMQKLLRPGGRILLLEHGRGTWDFINRILDKNAAPRAEVFGCRWNLDIGEIVAKSGLVVDKEERSHLGTTWTVFAHRPGDELPVEQKKRFLIW